MSVSALGSQTSSPRKVRAAAKSAALLGSPDEQVAGLVQELVAGWQQGERPLAEQFLAHHPELSDRPEFALRLIYEEICQRYEAGLEVVKEEFFQRFPKWQAELEILLASDDFVVNSSPPTFPVVGETFEGFQLMAELGRGGQGRVFLALEAALAGRPVVLKITAHDGQEHLSLARLQHTHIVPLYWARDMPSRNLRVLCMPYLGGATLARVLESLKHQPADQRTGQDLVSALDRIQGASPGPAAPFANSPVRQFLARLSYVRALCWISSCLAEALAYAHERGLVHLDLKPSNILLAADGQPMLLDFYLSQKPLAAAEPMPERFGGTVDFMSPEQKEVMAAFRQGKAVPAALDGRSDIYSLGLVLYEALGGSLEIAEEARLPPLHRCNTAVTPGFSDIIDKCVEREPGHRYANAGLLAADLRRYLADLSLQGVANRSITERWQKWRRRRPYALALGGLTFGLAATVLVASLIGVGHCWQRLHEAELALNDGREQINNGDHAEAARTLTRGLAFAEGIPGGRNIRDALRQELLQAKKSRLAHDLHLLADRMRFAVDLDYMPAAELQDLDCRLQELWVDAEPILSSAPDSESEATMRIDLLDLAILGAHLRVQSAGAKQKTEARKQALQLLAEAEKRLGPSPVLYRERQAYAEALGWQELARTARKEETCPQTAWEHFSLGLSLYRGKDFPSASRELRQAIDLQPQYFWPHFYLGKSAYRLGRFSDSLIQFSICVALTPDCAEAYHNRALVETALGHPDQAMRDYDRALERNPRLASAALNRGILHYQKNDFRKAASDLRRALEDGADPAVTLYNLALVQLAQGDRHSAAISVQQSLRYNPNHQEAAQLRDRLQRLR